MYNKSYRQMLHRVMHIYYNPSLNPVINSGQSRFTRLPKVTFGTMYDFLVERKVLAHKANRIDDIIEKKDSSSLHCQNVDQSEASDPIAYTRSLDKAYRF